MTTLSTRENTLSSITRRFGRQLGRRWQPGDRLPTVRELADELGVSHGTVYRALQQMVDRGMLVSKPRQGLFVSPDYSETQFRTAFPQADAMPAASTENMLAGKRVAIYCGVQSMHMFPARQVIETALAAQDCVVTTQDYPSATVEMVRTDCLVLINPSGWDNPLPSPNLPAVVVTTAAMHPKVQVRHLDIVSVNQEQGASEAARHLRSVGCQEACYVGVTQAGRKDYEITSQSRFNGFQAQWGDRIPEEHQFRVKVFSALGGAQAAKMYARLASRPRGVFAATDELAAGFISGAEALGFRLGQDYHLVGFDGMPNLKSLSPTGVPSVAVPAQWMGRFAVDMLLSRWANPDIPSRKLLLGCSLSHELPSA